MGPVCCALHATGPIAVLEHCDRQGVRAYLDTTITRNKRLDERHGSRPRIRSRPGGPPLWPMWWQPASDR